MKNQGAQRANIRTVLCTVQHPGMGNLFLKHEKGFPAFQNVSRWQYAKQSTVCVKSRYYAKRMRITTRLPQSPWNQASTPEVLRAGQTCNVLLLISTISKSAKCLKGLTLRAYRPDGQCFCLQHHLHVQNMRLHLLHPPHTYLPEVLARSTAINAFCMAL